MASARDIERLLADLMPSLRAWARNLAAGTREPRPDPDDVAHDAYLRLRGSATFAAVDNPEGFAFRTVKNLVLDHVRRQKPTVEAREHHLPVVEQASSPARVEAIVRAANLDDRERCLLFRVVFEQIAVTAAQRTCKGPPGAPYYVLDRIYDKLAAAIGVTR